MPTLHQIPQHYWLLAALALLAIGICGLILYTLRRGDTDKFFDAGTSPWPRDYAKPRRPDDPNWFLGGITVIGCIAVFAVADDRDARVHRAEQQRQAIAAAGYLPPEQARLDVNLNRDCPPRRDGLSDQLVMTISTQADTGPVITGCSRIAHRQWVREQGKGAKG